jgi:hypothetical protein
MGGITAEMRAEDPRLEKLVSVRGDRWYVGELCEHIARLAGVAVAAHDRDGAADPRVIAVVNGMALADAMNALRSLLSYDGAPFIWDRKGDAPAYRYVLCRSVRAQRLAGDIAARVRADFETECGKLLQLCRLPEDELKRLARTDPLAANMAKFPRVAAAWRMLGDAFSPETLAGVIRGDQTLTLPVADLPYSGRRFVDLVWSEGRHVILTPEGGRVDAPEPARIYIHSDYVGPTAAVALMIGLPHAGEYAYAGALPLLQRLSRDHMPAWIVSGDKATDPRENGVLSRPADALPEPTRGANLAFRLGQIADAARIGIMCRLPPPYDGKAEPVAYGAPLSRFLETLGRRHGIIESKWRGDVLLISGSGWSRAEAAQLTWLMEKSIRRSLAKKDGMSFREVAELAASLNEHQSQTVATDHPSLSFLRRPGVFAALGREPGLVAQVLSPNGVPFAGRFAELLAAKAGDDAPSRVSAFRYVEKGMTPVTGEDGKTTFVARQGHLWWLELKQPDGTWRPFAAIRRPSEEAP